MTTRTTIHERLLQLQLTDHPRAVQVDGREPLAQLGVPTLLLRRWRTVASAVLLLRRSSVALLLRSSISLLLRSSISLLLRWRSAVALLLRRRRSVCRGESRKRAIERAGKKPTVSSANGRHGNVVIGTGGRAWKGSCKGRIGRAEVASAADGGAARSTRHSHCCCCP